MFKIGNKTVINTKGRIYTGTNPPKIFYYIFLLAYINGIWTLIPCILELTPPDPPGGQGHPFLVKIGQIGGVTKNGSPDHVIKGKFFLPLSSIGPMNIGKI